MPKMVVYYFIVNKFVCSHDSDEIVKSDEFYDLRPLVGRDSFHA